MISHRLDALRVRVSTDNRCAGPLLGKAVRYLVLGIQDGGEMQLRFPMGRFVIHEVDPVMRRGPGIDVVIGRAALTPLRAALFNWEVEHIALGQAFHAAIFDRSQVLTACAEEDFTGHGIEKSIYACPGQHLTGNFAVGELDHGSSLFLRLGLSLCGKRCSSNGSKISSHFEFCFGGCFWWKGKQAIHHMLADVLSVLRQAHDLYALIAAFDMH